MCARIDRDFIFLSSVRPSDDRGLCGRSSPPSDEPGLYRLHDTALLSASSRELIVKSVKHPSAAISLLTATRNGLTMLNVAAALRIDSLGM